MGSAVGSPRASGFDSPAQLLFHLTSVRRVWVGSKLEKVKDTQEVGR
jgi:uncharacterized damage-inducible protein DinB